jgi:predicted Zn finger-like uncharacterized protein
MRIQCPECSQRFDVSEELMGKTVECGTCDGRFKVTIDEVVAEKDKFYPGEKRETHLERFGRNSVDAASPVAFQQAHYQANMNADRVGPQRPRRTVSTIIGVSLMSLIIVIFLLAGGKEGLMRDMETGNRFILVAFTALVGGALVIYGKANNRQFGVLLALVFGVILLALPVMFPANPTSVSAEPIVAVGTSPDSSGDATTTAIDIDRKQASYLFEIGYDPVSDALGKYPENQVVGIFLRNASETIRGKIGAYLYEVTDKASREIIYKRGESGNHGLVVLVEQKKSIDEIAALCSKFGRIDKIDRKLRVIDVVVESSKLIKLDPYNALDRDSLDYQLQNLKALKSIDPKERMKAVKRLADSEPKARRRDIAEALIQMLPESKTDLQLEIIKTLKKWSKPGEGAEPVVLAAVKQIHQQGKVDKTSMEFLVDRGVEGSEVILIELWDKDPVTWSDIVMRLGEGAQILLLPKIKEMDVAHLAAVSAILGKTGTAACIPHLEQEMASKDEHGKKSLQAAIDEIKKRQ